MILASFSFFADSSASLALAFCSYSKASFCCLERFASLSLASFSCAIVSSRAFRSASPNSLAFASFRFASEANSCSLNKSFYCSSLSRASSRCLSFLSVSSFCFSDSSLPRRSSSFYFLSASLATLSCSCCCFSLLSLSVSTSLCCLTWSLLDLDFIFYSNVTIFSFKPWTLTPRLFKSKYTTRALLNSFWRSKASPSAKYA